MSALIDETYAPAEGRARRAPPNAVVLPLPVTVGTIQQVQMPGDLARTVSVANNSHLWVYANAGSGDPTTKMPLKAVAPYTNSVFPVGGTRYVSFRVDVGPDGSSIGPSDFLALEGITVSLSPLPSPAGQDTPIQSVASTPQQKPVTQLSAANATNTITIAAKAGIGIRIIRATVSFSTTPASVSLDITDGTLNWEVNPNPAIGGSDYPALNLLFTPGKAVTVAENAAGAGITSLLTVIYQYG